MSDQQTIEDAATFWTGFVADVQALLTRIASLPGSTPIASLDFSSLNRVMDTAQAMQPEIGGALPVDPGTPTVPVTVTDPVPVTDPTIPAQTPTEGIPIASMHATATP